MIESDGSLPEGGAAGKNLLRLPKGCPWGQEGRFYRSCPEAPELQTTNNPPKPCTTSFFPLRKLKGNQPLLNKPAEHLAHLEEEDASNDEDQESDNPGGIEGVTEEFMVYLERAVKDTQADEKCCYHWSSPRAFHLQLPTCKDFQGKENS